MKKWMVIPVLVCLMAGVFAQEKGRYRDSMIRADTINLHGVIYDYEGKPVKNMALQARLYYYTVFFTKTDSAGRFEIKGADPNGGLAIADARYYYTYFSFKDRSRFVVIYLPPPRSININRNDSITVKAPRKHPAMVPSIKIQIGDPNNTIFDAIGSPPIDPQFFGGNAKLINYFRSNLVYPQRAVENNIEGLVEIEFDVDRGGKLTNFKILKGIGYGCDDEVIELLKKAGRWTPGIYNGRPFIVPITISVKFKLTDN